MRKEIFLNIWQEDKEELVKINWKFPVPRLEHLFYLFSVVIQKFTKKRYEEIPPRGMERGKKLEENKNQKRRENDA